MTFASLTFLHIADARLDCPLEYAGDVSEHLLESVEDATLTAFETAIQTAVERQVDFVLISGATFIENDLSLRARIAIVDGLETLVEYDISVFVVPSDEAPLPAWRAIPSLPEKVTICESGATLPVYRDQEAVATIWTGTEVEHAAPYLNGHTNGATNGHHRQVTPFRLGVITAPTRSRSEIKPTTQTETKSDDTEWQRPSWARPKIESATEPSPSPSESEPTPKHSSRFEYLTWASQVGPRWSDLPHQMNGVSIVQSLTPQPLTLREGSRSGVKMVKVRPDGRRHETNLPTACVRIQPIKIEVPNGIDRDDLLTAMAEAVLEPATARDEDILLIQWQLRGSGSLWASLRDRSTWQSLLEDAILTAELPDTPELSHAVCLVRDDHNGPDESLTARFARRLESEEALTVAELSQRLEQHWQAVPEAERVVDGRELLEDLLAAQDENTVRELAWTVGNDWLQHDSNADA